jgi:MFS family permease
LRTVSLLDVILFNYVLLAWAETHFAVIFLGIAAVFGAGTLIMTLKVREGRYPPPADAAAGKRKNFPALVTTYVRECYSRPYYLLLFSGMAAALLSFAVFTSFQLLYAKQLSVDLAQFGKVMAGCTVFSLVIKMPIGILADRIHPLRLGLTVLCAEAIVTALAAVLIRTQTGFFAALAAQCILSSCYYTPTASLPQRLYPRSRFSKFQSVGSSLVAFVTIPFGPALGSLLDRSHHDYRLTFAAASALSVTAALVLFYVYRRFLVLGGPEGYRAPGEPVVDLGMSRDGGHHAVPAFATR